MDVKKLSEIKLNHNGILPDKLSINLNASKSESNRALLIKALSKHPITIENLAIARDTVTMERLLNNSKDPIWDVLDAGTTMRFLSAYLAIEAETPKTITGTARMQQRPIRLLADALTQLGASIAYEGSTGYPPLTIGKITTQKTRDIAIPGNVSSQYISALLMIAPVLPHGLHLTLTGEIFSRPYINMTLKLMAKFGIHYEWKENRILIDPQPYHEGNYRIESDWSGASYWYGVVALATRGSLFLEGLRKDSFQGDQRIADLMQALGVKTHYKKTGVLLEKAEAQPETTIDFKDCPDLAQTIMAVAAAKNVHLSMTGLESLRIKETDRIEAMRTELSKLGAVLEEKNNTWKLLPNIQSIPGQAMFNTYDDHRMAMALAPLALKMSAIIEEPSVVDKSYPDYWDHLNKAGFTIDQA